jgi:ClpP class serine protease
MQAMVAEAGKPCFAYADELAASAAYGVAMVADSGVYLPASGQVGSIGTVMVHIDESGALEGAGVKATIVRSGPQKFTASSLEPLSAEARAKMQARVDMTAALWAGVVAERRGGTAASWLALEGAVFSGAEAVKVGLADGVASLDQVMAMAAAAAEEKGPSMAAAIDKSTVDVNALEVGKIAMALTGSADAEGAIKTLRAWQADSVLAQERAAADAKAAEEAEAKERVELVRGLVLRGMDPAKAWISGEKGPQPENGVHPDWAGMKLKNLRAFAAAMPTAPRQIEAKADPTGGGTIAMTPDIEKQAKAHGIKAEHIASSRALALNGSGTKEI